MKGKTLAEKLILIFVYVVLFVAALLFAIVTLSTLAIISWRLDVFTLLSIIAIVFSPLVAVGVSALYLDKKVFHGRKKFEVLVGLVCNKYAFLADQAQTEKEDRQKEMVALLNSLPLLYHDDERLKELFYDLYYGPKLGTPESQKRLFDIILHIAQREGFRGFTKEDLNRTFLLTDMAT